MRLAAFAVALAWASFAYAEPPPPVGWKGILPDDARIVCLTADQVSIFAEAHNDPDGPINLLAVSLFTDPPPKCALAKFPSEITVTAVVRLMDWDIGKGFSWPAYALEIGADKPFAWVLYLDANPLLGI